MHVFFRRIEVVGLEHVPAEGGVIFCGNHPNSLLDPVLITCFCGRVVHFAAKDVLFRSRLLGWLLHRMGAVPIMRRKDHAGGLSNEGAFERLYAVLGQGRAMGIFPEGLSHDAAHLARLKTGAARIAFGAAGAHPDNPLSVVPCGLHYVHRRQFRSSVLIQFGPAIALDPERMEAHTDDERGAVRALTDDIESGMRALTVNADDWDTLRVLDGARRLYQPRHISLEARVELSRRFNLLYPQVREQPEVKVLLGRVRAYLQRLGDLGMRDHDVTRAVKTGETLGRLLRLGLMTVIWVPLALVGIPLHVPVAWLLRWGSVRLSPRKDVIATTKFLSGFLILGGLYLALSLSAALLFSPWLGLAILLIVPLSGHATIRVLERGAALKRLLITVRRLLFFDAELKALRAERKTLTLAVRAMVDAKMPAEMERLFTPSEAP